jgi:hypothetical protein
VCSYASHMDMVEAEALAVGVITKIADVNYKTNQTIWRAFTHGLRNEVAPLRELDYRSFVVRPRSSSCEGWKSSG